MSLLAWFPIGVLGVWRITHLLAAEDGPWDLVARLRARAGAGFFGKLLDCFYCLSLWIAMPFALALSAEWLERGLLWPALSGGAILLERVTSRPATPPVAPYVEGASVSKEAEDALLRR
jgi:uncharacterized protein DUF1360